MTVPSFAIILVICQLANEPAVKAAPIVPIGGRLGEVAPASVAKTDLGKLAATLTAICEEEKNSYHRLLWRVHHVVRNSVNGQRFSEVSAALRKQPIVFLEKQIKQHHTAYSYLVKKGAYTTPSRQAHDLILTLNVGMHISADNVSQEKVDSTETDLVALIQAPFIKVVADKRYPAGTVIAEGLQLPEVRQAAEKHPTLQKVEVTYRFFGDRWREYNPLGFYLRIDLVDRAKDATAGQSLSIYASSGLDPMESWAGKKQLEGFRSTDELHGIFSRGGSEWQSGWGRGHHKLERSDDVSAPGPDEEISFGKTKTVWTPADVKALPPDTRSVRMKEFQFSRQTIEALTKLKSLEAFESDWQDFDDASLSRIATLPALKKLSLSGGEKITDQGLAHIGKLANLIHLSIRDGPRLTDAGFRHLSGLKNLRYLTLDWSEQVADKALAYLSELRQLRAFHPGGGITDQGLEFVGRLTELRSFTLHHTQHVTARGIEHLLKLKKLNELTAGYASVNDECMAGIGRLASLQRIDFHGIPITDGGLLHLARLNHLRYLYVEGCMQVSDKGLAALQAQLPGKYTRK